MLDIEPDLFSEFGNALNYHFVKRPWRNSRESFNHPKDISPNRTSGELVSVIINKWLEESELSTEIIRLDSSSIPIHCIINTDQIRALYNLVVGVNIMSMSFAKHLIQDMVLILIIKFMRSLSRYIIPSLEILHILPIQVEGTPSQRKLVGSLPWGIPMIVVYRQIGAQATNSMVTQDTDKGFCPSSATVWA